LAIAIDCFSRHGFAGTSIDQVAKAAGVTKGAIYYHFKDKEDLLAAAVADRVTAFESSVQRTIEEVSADAALRQIAQICCRNTLKEDQTRFTIKLMVEAIDSMPKINEQLRGMMRRFRGFLRNIVREGQASGVLRADIDPSVLAANFTSTVIGAQVQFYQDQERFDLEATLSLYVDQMLVASAAQPPAVVQDQQAH
jgi:TetR/AcrR family acrAB operon transcriptional repressor